MIRKPGLAIIGLAYLAAIARPCRVDTAHPAETWAGMIASDDLRRADALGHRRGLPRFPRATAVARFRRIRLGLLRPGSLVFLSPGPDAHSVLAGRRRRHSQ